MGVNLKQPAANPFWFRECFLMPMPMGRKAATLRELHQALHDLPESVLFFHLLQSRLALTQPAVEYPNDFASWAATALQDSRLAEKLSAVDPFDYEGLGQVRQALVDLLQEYIWELPDAHWARPGFEFHFCEASTVVMQSEIAAANLQEFCQALRQVGLDSLYYHFFEARWRLGVQERDDFSYWIETNFGQPALVKAIREIDVYFYTLPELRDILIDLVQRQVGRSCDQPE
jgi:hypothetical protein